MREQYMNLGGNTELKTFVPWGWESYFIGGKNEEEKII